MYDRGQVEDFVDQYQSKLEKNEIFPCYKDSKNPQVLVENIKYNRSSAFHSFLWPLGFMIIFFALFYILRTIAKRQKLPKNQIMQPDILLDLENSLRKEIDH